MLRLACDRHGFAAAAHALRCGEVVAYPTETVYGLGVDPGNPEAIKKLYGVKGRGRQQSVILIGDTVDDFVPYVREFSAFADAVAARFWPGPLSLVLPAHEDIARTLIGPNETVCVRIPGLDSARELCQAFGGAITSTSANRSGEAPALNADDAALPDVAVLLDGGILGHSDPSTVYDPERRTVLRAGAVAEETLRAFESEWSG